MSNLRWSLKEWICEPQLVYYGRFLAHQGHYIAMQRPKWRAHAVIAYQMSTCSMQVRGYGSQKNSEFWTCNYPAGFAATRPCLWFRPTITAAEIRSTCTFARRQRRFANVVLIRLLCHILPCLLLNGDFRRRKYHL